MIDLGWYFDHIFLLGCPIEVISEALESLFKDLQIIFHNIVPNLDVSGGQNRTSIQRLFSNTGITYICSYFHSCEVPHWKETKREQDKCFYIRKGALGIRDTSKESLLLFT